MKTEKSNSEKKQTMIPKNHYMKSSVTTTLVLWLSCISLSSSLAASTICRNSLYLAALISLVDLFVKKTKIKLNPAIIIIITALLLSISMYLPTIIYSSVKFHDIDLNYRETSKRIFLGVIIGFYLISHRDRISSRGWISSYFWILLGFVYTVILALKLATPHQRLEINTVATMTAYIFAVLSLSAIYISLKLRGWIRHLSVIIIVFSSCYVLLLTQTRSVFLTYPILLLAILIKEKFFNKHTSIIFLMILSFSALVFPLKFHAIFDRVSQSIVEYKEYQNNNDSTSLGSRLSMWKAGFFTNNISILGESADHRDVLVREYIHQYENGNNEALRVIKYHYHNDLLEAGTLRGVFGFIILLTFYIVTIIASRKFTGNYNMAILLVAPTWIYGSTDSVLIDHRFVTILILLLPFYLCSEKLKNQEKTEHSNNQN
ncbi:O-antigen ligase family protein [Erwinia sp. AnSW2-5]|uniref:O-antigen ligase family protein n=1 Tax=Erwinia sp. AnSW2-5 TaxID=3367692 RepID=UPI00385A938B